MFGRKLQFVLGSLAACSLLAGSAADSNAQCNCLRRPALAAPVIAAPVAPITSYRPAFFAPAAPVIPQTVNYMPYTAYRTVYTNMPVTTYQPAAACGPCGATTVMRPVTTYALRPQLVPYTTYRPVYAPVVAAYAPVAPACSPCGGAVGVPLVQSQMATSAISPFAPAAPCTGCAAPAGPPVMGPPVGQYGNPGMQGMPGSPVPSLGQPNINLPPSLNGPPGQPLAPSPQPNTTFSPPAGSTIIGPPTTTYSATPRAPGTTFSNQPSAGSANGSSPNGSTANGSSAPNGGSAGTGTSAGNSQPESRLKPLKVIPDIAPPPPADFRPGTPSGGGPDGIGNPGGSFDDSAPKAKDTGIDGQKTNLQQPRMVVPDPQDRMTARPIRQTTAYRSVSADPVMQAAAQPALLDDGGWRAARPAN